ncbi:DinB family protein [Maribacter thermophilus]|uniref:DinB family protein n=1 Tax=Maribacter thermophilus TaxID=1197874 RepID=UPI000640C6B4|nr:DinB family protein [Maribacter thermophilus]
MKNQLELTLQSRKNLQDVLTSMDKESLLKIPKEFRNNVWWNIAHVVVTQQILVYKFGGLQMRIPDEMVAKFMKGTVPDGTATDEEIKIVSDLLIDTVDWTGQDLDAGLFKGYKAYKTSAGFYLNSLEDAISFNLYHEGLHMAAIISLRKMLKN